MYHHDNVRFLVLAFRDFFDTLGTHGASIRNEERLGDLGDLGDLALLRLLDHIFELHCVLEELLGQLLVILALDLEVLPDLRHVDQFRITLCHLGLFGLRSPGQYEIPKVFFAVEFLFVIFVSSIELGYSILVVM